jgi:DNA-binding CsgD family transcriptional regulator
MAGTVKTAGNIRRPAAVRARQLAQEAFVAASVTGDLHAAEELLAQAIRTDPAQTPEHAIAASYLLISAGGDVTAAHHLLTAADALRRGETETIPSDAVLRTLVQVCQAGGHAWLWQEMRRQLACQRDPDRPAGNLSTAALISALADPARLEPRVLGRLDAEIAAFARHTAPSRVIGVAAAASYIDRLPACRQALRRVARDERAAGHLVPAIHASTMLALERYQAGQWDEARRLAEATAEECAARGYRVEGAGARLVCAFVAADSGDTDVARELADEVIGWAAPRGARRPHAAAQWASARAALAESDFEAAYHYATSISPPGELASYEPAALWTVLDLVEAASRTGRVREAAAHVAAIRRAGLASLSPRLALLAATAEAMTLPDDEAGAAFGRAVAIPGAGRWPFDLARAHLLYGERIRRSRSMGYDIPRAGHDAVHVIAEARVHLAAAHNAFQRLGSRAWADRAAVELRATAQVRQRRPVEALTPQELEVARLAATGLTNKQIGTRLYVSHRTVSAHLYRVFQKLGITSRAALWDALSGLPEAAPRPDNENGSALPAVGRALANSSSGRPWSSSWRPRRRPRSATSAATAMIPAMVYRT